MRLKIFGIPKFVLFFLACLPGFIWGAFHFNSITLGDRTFQWLAATYLLLALFFPIFFCRGVFKSRYLVYFFLFAATGYELFAGVLEKDFSRLSEALVAFGLGIWLTFWLEKRMNSADVNPKSQWFEGAPHTHPQIRAKIKTGDQWADGNLRSIDDRGFFVFLTEKMSYSPKQNVAFEIKYRDLLVSGDAKLNACFSGERQGFGLQFYPKDLYHFSQYTAFVQRLKGEGL